MWGQLLVSVIVELVKIIPAIIVAAKSATAKTIKKFY